MSSRCLILPLLLLLCGSVLAQHQMVAPYRSPDWSYDPDDRPVLGFSVRDSQAARVAINHLETLLADGQVQAAGREALSVIADFGEHVVQVDGGRGRWVGAAEWALYLLRAHVPADVRAGLVDEESVEAVANAAAWRDLATLRRLGWRLQGTPVGRSALAWSARLHAERGELPAARAAATRAQQLRSDPDLDALLERVQEPVRPEPERAQPPESLNPHWYSPLVSSRVGRRNPFAPMPRISEAPIAPVVPVVDQGVVYIADSISVYALDLLSGRSLWRHVGPMEAIARDPTAHRDVFDFTYYTSGQRQRAVSPYLHARPTLGEQRLFAAVQVPEPRRELHRLGSIPINYPLPRRRLVALDRATGALLWRQERPELGEGAFLNRFDVAGPPTLADGVLYVAGTVTDGAVNSYVAAFDPTNGELLWHTFLCAGQQDLTMFNRPFQEHTSSPLLVTDGSVYVSTNLGVVACVDAWSGRMRWLTGYESTARRASRYPNSDQARDIYWINQLPLMEGGRLLVAPLDSAQLLALEPDTGQLAYEIDVFWGASGSLRHEVLGLGDGRMVVTGDKRVECFDASNGYLRWSVSLPADNHDYIIGAGTLHDGHLLLPARSGLLDVELTEPGRLSVREWEGGLEQLGVRRVIVAGPVLLMTDNEYLYGAVDLQRALADAMAGATESPKQMLAAAELLLSAEHFIEAEAFFERLLPDVEGSLALRASSGRLEAALRSARSAGTRARWEALLETARRLGTPWEVAAEALVGLDAIGETEATSAWLDELAELDAEHELDLGLLNPDGPQPVGLTAALRHLANDTPAAAIDRMHDLIVRWPDRLWNGVPVHEVATRRTALILAAHGRGLYERIEREARDAMGRADDAASLLEVEARYPNARVVADARLLRVAARLQDGFAAEVFEELTGASMLDADESLLALRERAARTMGEHVYADVLAGRSPAGRRAPLPALPAGELELVSHKISERGTVILPPVSGRADPAFDGCVLGAVNAVGDMFLLDALGDGVRWRRPLPGGLSFPTAGYVDFAQQGDKLFIEVLLRQVLETVSLENGQTLWQRGLPGDSRSLVAVGGLVLRLHTRPGDGGRRFAVTGYGATTGVQALSVDLPPCVDARLFTAGPFIVVFTAGDPRSDGTMSDARLSILDIVHGTLEHSVSLPGASPTVMLTLDEPPMVLLYQRDSAPGSGTRLMAWDPATREIIWQSDRLAGVVARPVLYSAGAERLLLLESGAVLTPVDARDGPGLPLSMGEPVRILFGQSVGDVPRLVMKSDADPSLLLIADARGAGSVMRVSLAEAVSQSARVTHARDGFLLTSELLVPGGDVRLAIFDGEDGEQRYSIGLDRLDSRGRTELVLVEGAVVLANGGTIRILRSLSGTQPHHNGKR